MGHKNVKNVVGGGIYNSQVVELVDDELLNSKKIDNPELNG